MGSVLFDFFGTLVEYQPDRSRLGSPRSHQLATELGFTGDHDAFVATWDGASSALERTARSDLREFSMADAALAFADAASLTLMPEAAQSLGACYVDEWSRHIVPIAGVPDLIAELAQQHSIAVVSNTHDADMVPNLLAKMDVDHLVSAMVLSVEHGRQKPHPSIYTEALRQLGCDPVDAVFIGDSREADYDGPRRLGMSALLIDPTNEHHVASEHRLATVLDAAAAIARIGLP